MIRAFQILTLFLALSYILSLLASFGWFFDLFSHFMLQYAAGGLVLSIGFAILKKRLWALAALAICLLSLGELYTSYDFHDGAAGPAAFTIVQYNRNHGLSNHSATKSWLSENAANFDVVVMQEAGADIAALADELKPLYPYQIIEDRPHAFGMVVLSRHAFTSEKIKMSDGPYSNFILHFEIQPETLSSPLSIYALHALTPVGEGPFSQRNQEISYISNLIEKDLAKNIILIGDLNITPYSPFFKPLINQAKLRNQITSLSAFFTWPRQFQLPIFQIPIDHILYKGDLALIDKARGPALGSDHYSLIASFGEAAHN